MSEKVFEPHNTLLDTIVRAAKLLGQHVSPARLQTLRERIDELLEKGKERDPLLIFQEAWTSSGLTGVPRRPASVSRADLPLVFLHQDHGWVIIERQGHDGSWLGTCVDGSQVEIDSALLSGQCIALPRETVAPVAEKISAFGLVFEAMLQRKGIYRDAAIATALISVLALATSLYAMQIYDRVIPQSGYQTLIVLSVGVTISILIELFLKQMRSVIADRTGQAIDRELSEWFFRRALGIRMEARPNAIGTLASQIKGFELVRGFLASTSLFVIAEIPFAVMFVGVMAMIGGWVAVVPLILLPISLALGIYFSIAIRKHTEKNLVASHRKAGLLVEALDGAEALKANSGEWSLQGRWNRLVDEVNSHEEKTRSQSSLSQNIMVSMQQISYVGIVSVGAMLVANNEMTMGALIACSIISNRALAPFVQLSGVMVQWAHARAALQGLQQIVTLPNEDDDVSDQLVPQTIVPSYQLEQVRFVYGSASRSALEVEKLQLKAGERVGLVGPIGSGKSTFLKLLSGLYRPVEGRIFFGGLDFASVSPSVVREKVGYLPQESRLFSGSLRDNLLLGLPDPGEDVILEAAKRTGLFELIASHPSGLALEITEGGRGVSGGQKQLIAITRMLIANPQVWLLDEPTGSMDTAAEARIVKLLGELCNEGATMILSTHKSALLPLLSRLIVIQSGKITIDGPKDVVLAKIAVRRSSEGVEATQ